MPDAYIQQLLSITVTQPDTPWKADVILSTPFLVGPDDGDTFCLRQSGAGSGILLDWAAVSGATFYIVEWCGNSSFRGPTLRSTKTANSFYELQSKTDIRIRETVHWRVMAYNGAGGVSGKSESRQVSYWCNSFGGPKHPTGLGDSKQGGPKGKVSKCSDFDISFKLFGQDTVKCCDLAMFHLQLVWNCKDANDQNLLTFDGVAWTIIEPVADANNNIIAFDNKRCQVQSECDKSQIFTLVATATFTDLVEGGQFTCEARKEVFVDCDTWKYGPALPITGLAGGGVFTTIHADYFGGSLGESSPGSSTNNDFVFEQAVGTEDAGPAGTITPVNALAVGPSMVVGQTGGAVTPSPAKCSNELATSRLQLQMESQVNLSFGCGLSESGNRILVNNDHLAGESGSRKGLAPYGLCSLQVNPGCGIEIPGEEVKVKLGNGLEFDGDCAIAISYGCGLTLDGDYALAIDTDPLSDIDTLLYPVLGSWDLELIDGCTLRLTTAWQEKLLQGNDCGVLIGPLVDGSSVSRVFEVELKGDPLEVVTSLQYCACDYTVETIYPLCT